MRIRMTVDLQGYTARSDGSIFEWPSRGSEIELEDAHAIELVRQGYAIPIQTRGESETARLSDVDEEQRMVTSAKLFTRPQSTPPDPILVEDSVAVIRETVEPPEPAPEPIAPASEPPIVKRGPGRPRKVIT